jgi:hypothetical protein
MLVRTHPWNQSWCQSSLSIHPCTCCRILSVTNMSTSWNVDSDAARVLGLLQAFAVACDLFSPQSRAWTSCQHLYHSFGSLFFGGVTGSDLEALDCISVTCWRTMSSHVIHSHHLLWGVLESTLRILFSLLNLVSSITCKFKLYTHTLFASVTAWAISAALAVRRKAMTWQMTSSAQAEAGGRYCKGSLGTRTVKIN